MSFSGRFAADKSGPRAKVAISWRGRAGPVRPLGTGGAIGRARPRAAFAGRPLGPLAARGCAMGAQAWVEPRRLTARRA